jgi:hypothetical protein
MSIRGIKFAENMDYSRAISNGLPSPLGIAAFSPLLPTNAILEVPQAESDKYHGYDPC